MNDIIKQTIKDLRKKKRLTQKDVADKLNIARSTYSKFESGNTKLDHERLIIISEILEVPLAEIIKSNGLSTSDNLSFMFSRINWELSEDRLKIIPFDELQDHHYSILKTKNLDSRKIYEDTPLGGRIYDFGPNDVFRFMVENYGMDILFKQNLILDNYWTTKWNEYLNQKTIELSTEKNEMIQIDEKNYFLVYMVLLQFEDGEEEFVQFAERDFPKGAGEAEALTYLKYKTGALDGDILCFTFDGYDPVTTIIK